MRLGIGKYFEMTSTILHLHAYLLNKYSNDHM